jgi:NAD(P)-dependent dehydrogenase (short-subunit alcohol dehydrogenase family)
MGAVEDLSIDEIKTQFETNVFGAIRIIHSVIPVMRKQRSGTIFLGRTTAKGNSIFSSQISSFTTLVGSVSIPMKGWRSGRRRGRISC